MKVGIVPNSADFTNPGDRRKLCHYCELKGISLEIASFHKYYDILYLSGKTDMTLWPNYKRYNNFKNTKIIFDASDPYLSDPGLKNIIRAIYFFLFRKTKYLDFNYSTSFRRMIKNSDVIICASYEQKEEIKGLHHNIYILRDYFENEIHDKKNNWELKNNEINFFWEGQAHANLLIFRLLKKILLRIKGFKLNLHIVTDEKFCLLGGQYICFSTKNLLERLFNNTGITIHFYDWSSKNLSIAAKKSDIALIPIPNKKRLLLKPENKMILMWLLGLPVIASKTESHQRVMKSIQSEWLCSTIEEWESKIMDLVKNRKERINYLNSINSFLENEYSTKKISRIWDKIISI